ncbi:hypothetical protein HYN86_05045 [Flavobacterium fluviale]|uniref:Uncharacterized protein n=1 Tax=Flavobacterium fluviale TaxID=2249356 RepID=A0A344LQ11_9FLAO|nr:hypothetical protein HYN86_05045 [Flavobacterium fluviale]
MTGKENIRFVKKHDHVIADIAYLVNVQKEQSPEYSGLCLSKNNSFLDLFRRNVSSVEYEI